MDPIVIVEGAEAEMLCAQLSKCREGDKIRFAYDEGGIKVKVNEQVWSYVFGTTTDH